MTAARHVVAGVFVGLAAGAAGAGDGVGPAAAAQAPSSFQRLWYQAYDEGRRAVQRGDWTSAIALLEAAKRSGPAPGRRVLFQGDRVDVFNPDYYLGLAYSATKRFREAAGAFARVADERLIVPGDHEYDELRRQAAAAEYETALVDAARALTAGRYGEAEAAVSRFAGGTLDDGRATQLAKRVLEESRQAAATAPPPTPVESEPKAAEQPVSADPPPTPVATNTTPPIAPTKTSQTKVPPTKPDAGTPAPYVPTAPVIDLDTIVLRGATAYYEGRYGDVGRILTPAFARQQVPPLAALYAACSQAALVAGGRADGSRLDEARALFQTARSSPDLARHLRYISPRVRELLGDVAETAR